MADFAFGEICSPLQKKRIMEGIRDLFKLSEARKQGAAKLTVFFID